MTYRLTAAIAEDPNFRARVRACLLHAAQHIAGEPDTPGSDSTEGGQHVDASFTKSARARLAYDTLAEPATAETPFAWVCAANAQVQSGATLSADGEVTVDDGSGKADDAALYFLVSSSWDRVARWRSSGA